MLTDLVSLVRHAVQLDDELVPYPERVQRRYADWLAAQQTEGRAFTSEQRWWLDQVATHIGVNLEIHAEDFNYGEFFNRGGQIERRYMRAIPMDAVCLTCHGAVLAPDLAAVIKSDYPDDQATGFEQGQLRGAFSVTWPSVAPSPAKP